MNYMQANAQFETIEEGIEKLKSAVEIRDKMGGAMYFNILNEDCCQIASHLIRMGANREIIGEILGKENFR